MHFQIVAVFCLVAVAYAGYIHHEEHRAPQYYKFGYGIKSPGGTQFRHEEGGPHGSVKGSYGYVDHKGLRREVHYVADKNGFRAQIETNEPGTANQDPAHVKIHSSADQHQYDQQPHHAYGHHN